MISIREIIEEALPAFLSKPLISLGENYKRLRRDKQRVAYGGGRPFFKEIQIEGVSFKILLDPVKNSGVDEDIAKRGFWERELSANLKRYIPANSIFLDIGANIGYHSLFVSALMKGTGKVYSFEPLPDVCEQLKKSIHENGFTNIQVCNFGLAEKQEEKVINIRDENTGGSSLLELPNLKKFKIRSTQTVLLKRLDDYLPDSTKVTALKIDVEGYEYEALQGAVNILKKNHPVIFMEFSPVFYIQESLQKPYNLISFLKNLGYSFFDVQGKHLNLEDWLKQGDNIHSQVDIICEAK